VKLLSVDIASEDAMVAAGQSLAEALKPGMAVFLRGELGAGKTTFARGVARGLGHTGAVKSPTYTLVEPYSGLSPPLFHFDLYRLGDPEELEFMGIRDYFNESSIALVEWPERGGDFLPTPDLEITIAVQGMGRRVELAAHSGEGSISLNALAPHLPPRNGAVA
jgi:tRNA threonylcarbamoyladenosine biosynthesis protein TsaE